MTTASLKITQAGPQVSLQDAGRFGLLRYGVPASGPMDRYAFAIANLALGNPSHATAIEISLGGLTLGCTEGDVSFAIAGGSFQATLDRGPLSPWCVSTLRAGQTLEIRPGRWGSWCYLAFAGSLQCRPWLGSASTHGPSGFGGGVLTAGGSLTITDASLRPDLHRTIPCPVSARPRRTVRVVLGPQDRFFGEEMLHSFLTQPFRLSDAYDRMGVRLEGPPLLAKSALDIPSEPLSRGAVQIAGDGVATVLLADHQTTGGYPKIATILADDLDGFVQLRSRSAVRFNAVSPEDAISVARMRHAGRVAYLSQFKASS